MHVLSLTSSLIFRFLFLISTFPISPAKPTASHPPALPRHRHRELSVDYYSKKCPQLESLVGSVTSQRFKEAPVSAPATIRLFFHDCFVEVKYFYQNLSIAFTFFALHCTKTVTAKAFSRYFHKNAFSQKTHFSRY